MSLSGPRVLRLKPRDVHRQVRRVSVRRVRVGAPSRAQTAEWGDPLRCGGLVLDLDAHLALANGTPLPLSHLQFLVLAELVRHAGQVVTSAELRAAAADAVVPTERTVTSTVSRLRSHMQGASGGLTIEVVRGRGYRAVAHN